MTSIVVAAFYFGVIGAAVAAALRADFPGDRLGRFGHAFLLGVGVNGTLLFIAGLLGLAINRTTCIVLLVAALIAGFAMRKRRRQHSSENLAAPPPVAQARLALVLMLIPVAFAMVDAVSVPLRDWDGRAFWVLKGKAIAHEESITGPFFNGLGARNLHSEYPLMMPLADASMFALLGDDDDRHVRGIYVLSGLALLLVMRGWLTRSYGTTIGSCIPVAVAWLPQFATAEAGSMLTAYADLPLTAFAAAGLLESVGRGRPVLVGLWAAFALQTKNEGMVIAAAILAIYGVMEAQRDSMRSLAKKIAVALIPVALTFALLAAWRAMIPLEYDENYAGRVSAIASALPNLASAARLFLARAIDPQLWGVFWLIVVAAIPVAIMARGRRLAIASVAFIVLVSIAYVVAYAVSGWKLDELAKVSGGRLLLHLVPAAAVLLAEAARALLASPNAAPTAVEDPL